MRLVCATDLFGAHWLICGLIGGAGPVAAYLGLQACIRHTSSRITARKEILKPPTGVDTFHPHGAHANSQNKLGAVPPAPSQGVG